jgi:hypothetical protein
MTVRAPANPPAFTDTVCEATIPTGATAASVALHSLPVRRKKIRRIAFLGDTGCKIKGSKVQACNSSAAWPFGSIAASIAAERPDLVVHLGDVHYRFQPCPTGMPPPGCSGSPFGVNSQTLRADWFTPAAPLFAAAPLVMARGNHENCDDGDDWVGWFRYFAFGPVPSSCQMFTAPYTVQLTSHQQLIVLDDSSAKDTPTPSLVKEYRAELDEVVRLATRPTWLVSHVPLWQVKRGNAGEGGVATLEQAMGGLPRPLPPDLHLVISGDVHQFEYLGFGGQHASQLILGDGGVLMSKAVKGTFSGRSVDGAKVLDGRAAAMFGYGVITLPKKQSGPGAPIPVAIMHVNGSQWLACSLARSRLDCKNARRGRSRRASA